MTFGAKTHFNDSLSHLQRAPTNMDNNGATPGGRAKRNKREVKKKKDGKGPEARDGPRERKTAASTGASAIPPDQLSMSMPIILPDPRAIDVLPPRPRQMNYAFSKQSQVSGATRDFYDVADK